MALTAAQGGGRAGISFDEKAWAKVVNRYVRAADKVSLVQRGLVSWAMAEGIKEARHQIDTLVYKAPRSASGYERTGDTRQAISKKAGPTFVPGYGATGTIHVDQSVANRKGFYYPFILNRGRTDIRYYPRPFWSATKAVMRVRLGAQGRIALRQLHQELAIG
jgi:hypothetical protein